MFNLFGFLSRNKEKRIDNDKKNNIAVNNAVSGTFLTTKVIC